MSLHEMRSTFARRELSYLHHHILISIETGLFNIGLLGFLLGRAFSFPSAKNEYLGPQGDATLYFGTAVESVRLCCNTATKNPPVSCKCGYMRMLYFIRSQKSNTGPIKRTIFPGRVLPLVANDSVRDALCPSHQEEKRCSLRMCLSILSHGRPSEAISSGQDAG